MEELKVIRVNEFYNDGWSDFNMEEAAGQRNGDFKGLISWGVIQCYNGYAIYQFDFTELTKYLIQKKYIKDDLNVQHPVERFVDILMDLYINNWEQSNEKSFYMDQLKYFELTESEWVQFEALFDGGLEFDCDWIIIKSLNLKLDINYFDGSEDEE